MFCSLLILKNLIWLTEPFHFVVAVFPHIVSAPLDFQIQKNSVYGIYMRKYGILIFHELQQKQQAILKLRHIPFLQKSLEKNANVKQYRTSSCKQLKLDKGG